MKNQKPLLRLATSGSMHAGKSTLIERLLFETGCINQDSNTTLKTTTEKSGQGSIDLAQILDNLSTEREQDKSIHVTSLNFETKFRKFIISDCPGDEQYTRNMVTGASNADLAIILIDARKGVSVQSKRLIFLASLLRTPHIIVCVNKMDLVEWSQDVFENIVKECKSFTQKMSISHIDFIPVSALKGDDIAFTGPHLGWYNGNSLLSTLEQVDPVSRWNQVDFRFPIQTVIRPDLKLRGYVGQIASGSIALGEEVAVLPGGQISKVKSLESYQGESAKAFASESTVITLEDEIEIHPGNMLVRRNNLPLVENSFDTLLCWMSESPLKIGSHYIIKHTCQETTAFITQIKYKIDIHTLHRSDSTHFELNDMGRVEIKTAAPLFFDAYTTNRMTGSFILMDQDTHTTVAIGWIKGKIRSVEELRAKYNKATHQSPSVSTNVSWQDLKISREKREKRNGHKGAVLWLTGYSGAGKSTIAKALEAKLFENKYQTILLDGDNVRHGLCGDLGFSDEDRTENIRRVAEVAQLFFETGNIVICTFISPFKKDREFARSLIPADRFFEVFVKCHIDVCKKRDPKGLYKKALAGEIKDFTGVSSNYEEPENPEVVLETENDNIQQIVDQMIHRINENFSMKRN